VRGSIACTARTQVGESNAVKDIIDFVNMDELDLRGGDDGDDNGDG
jgi:hypothetical protein